jgi:signal transduction histidine kinase
VSLLPVRWRLTLAFAVVIAVVLVATGLFVHGRLASSLDGSIDRGLRSRATDIATLAQQSDTALSESSSEDSAPHVPALAQLVNAAGQVTDRTPGLPARPLLGRSALAQARTGQQVMREIRLGDDRVRLIGEAVRAQDQRLIVIVGQSLEDRARALDNLAGVLLIGGPAALLLASLAGYLLTGAALAPVEAMRRRAAEISADDLGQRLPGAGGDDELGRLGRTLNEMLERVDAAVARERTFVADASHELRSPLAMLRTELELLGRERPTGAALQRAVGSAIEETDRLSHLADDLLLLARADERRLALDAHAVPAVELLQAAADRAGDRRVVLDGGDGGDGGTILADRVRVGQALDNLLANALRYADREVLLLAQRRDGSVELHVLDDGPGFPVGFLPRAWERFTRVEAGRTEDGAGLGLAIVRTIAELHGGRTGAANRADGGADVWLELPAALPARSTPTATPAIAPPRDPDRAGSRA